MKINQIIINESSSGTSTAGSVATFAKPLGEVQKRIPVENNKLKKKGPYANSLSEGKMNQLSLDLKGAPDGLNDADFKKKYGKTKAEARKELQRKPEPQKKPETMSEADLHEEDKIIAVGKGSKLKTGLHGKSEEPKFRGFLPPFKTEGMHVSDKRGNSVCECGDHSMAPVIAKALNAYAVATESIKSGGVVAAGGVGEGKNPGLWANIHAKQERIKHGSSERMRKPGSKGAPTSQAFKDSAKTTKNEGAKVDRMIKHIAQSEKKLGHSKKEAENIAWKTANKRGMLDNKNKKAK